MDISSISSMMGMQQDLASSTASQTAGEDFKNVLSQAIDSKDDTKLKEACDGLESYMLSMVLKQVKQSMLQDDENSLIPKGDYVGMFEENMINSVADKVVEAGGIGLSDQLYNQIKSTYEAQMQISSENQTAALTAAKKVEEEA